MHRAQRRCSAHSRRVTRIALTIITAFLICWTPFHVVQLVNLTASPSAASFYLNQLTICLSYAHSCVSPVLVLFCTEFFRERIAHSRYCRFIARWRALRAGTALPSQELTSTVYSPQVGNTAAQRHRHPFGTEQLPCSMTKASVTVNGQEEHSAVYKPPCYQSTDLSWSPRMDPAAAAWLGRCGDRTLVMPGQDNTPGGSDGTFHLPIG
ncbi:melanin concentrating hormone receptor 1 [Chelydra serpentina]|uniref:Melanin concentrating hormone receptor 1 n=1 Tax=Chelydra serpentina TaxID=8475 RepID=A0A8T1S3B3_CHESE|nr:melanin concentrating hormone receptor 1 [Chelydra serpentina]